MFRKDKSKDKLKIIEIETRLIQLTNKINRFISNSSPLPAKIETQKLKCPLCDKEVRSSKNMSYIDIKVLNDFKSLKKKGKHWCDNCLIWLA